MRDCIVMERTARPDSKAESTIDQLERAIRSLLNLIGEGGVSESLQFRADLITSIFSLLSDLRVLWEAGELDATLNQRIAELHVEVAECMRELLYDRPN